MLLSGPQVPLDVKSELPEEGMETVGINNSRQLESDRDKSVKVLQVANLQYFKDAK